jgi:hypothetical protein
MSAAAIQSFEMNGMPQEEWLDVMRMDKDHDQDHTGKRVWPLAIARLTSILAFPVSPFCNDAVIDVVGINLEVLLFIFLNAWLM